MLKILVLTRPIYHGRRAEQPDQAVRVDSLLSFAVFGDKLEQLSATNAGGLHAELKPRAHPTPRPLPSL